MSKSDKKLAAGRMFWPVKELMCSVMVGVFMCLPALMMAREITSVSYDPGTKSATVELTADEGGNGHVIYWAWSEDLQDKGAQIDAWPNVVRVCRVAADETSRTFALPDAAAPSGSSAFPARAFLATSTADYDYLIGSVKTGSGSGGYVNTGVCPNKTTALAIDAQYNSGTASKTLFGVAGTVSDSQLFSFSVFINSSSKFASSCNDSKGDWKASVKSKDTTRHTFHLDANTGYLLIYTNGELIDNTSYRSLSTITRTSSNYPIYLFARNNRGTIDQTASATIYSCVISNGNACVRHYVPCVRNGEIGFFDFESRTFYGSANETPLQAADSATVAYPPEAFGIDVGDSVVAASSAFAGANYQQVTAETVTGEVSLPDGAMLLVDGSGLGADASIVFQGGGTILFRTNATITSSISVPNAASVNVKTLDTSVTGTVAGVMTMASSSTLRINSPGLLIFSGGGTWGDFQMRGGHADVTGRYEVTGAQGFYAGHMTVRDGGYVNTSQKWEHLHLDYNTTDVCLEIATGGTWYRPTANIYTYIGNGAAHESKLLISGGTFYASLGGTFELKAGSTLEIDKGLFRMRSVFTCSGTKENCRMIIRDGTWYIPDSRSSNIDYANRLFGGTGTCSVLIDGHATLASDYRSRTPDTTNDTPQATWTCTEGARLKLIGRDNASGSTFRFHNFEADGLAFDLDTSKGSDAVSGNGRKVNVEIYDPKAPIGIGYVLPGKSDCLVKAAWTDPEAEHTIPDVLTTYVATDGTTLDIGNLPTGWLDGFGTEMVSNLVFDAGSTLRFPFFGGAAPLAIPGTLSLPSALDYTVAVSGPKVVTMRSPVIVPANGIRGEDCTFSCKGGVRPSAAKLEDDDETLAFSYTPPGLVIAVQ